MDVTLQIVNCSNCPFVDELTLNGQLIGKYSCGFHAKGFKNYENLPRINDPIESPPSKCPLRQISNIKVQIFE